MKKYNIAILGATGAVGQQMLKVLLERKLPYQHIKLLASKRSAGKVIHMEGKEFIIEETTEHSFDNIDFVLCAAENEVSLKYTPIAVAKGAIVIDNSSAYRLDEQVPLIIPEVNPHAIQQHKGIIANPNCATIIALVALQPLHAYATIKRLVVSTYQAVSGAGVGGIQELDQQIKAIQEQKPILKNVFTHQIAYNLIPQIGDFNELGYTAEEMKMQKEGRKILENQDLAVNCTCVRVPIYRSHSESILVEFQNEIDVAKAKELLQDAPGVKLVDNLEQQQYPMPIDTSDQDLVYVGRIRKDLSNHKHALTLWCCGDQIRKGAATNAVQILELLLN